MRYIGCKTLLLDNIKTVIDEKAPNAKSLCDVFSGTSTVARFFKQWYEIYSNDLLYFSYVLQRGTIECIAEQPAVLFQHRLVCIPIADNLIQTLEALRVPRSVVSFDISFSCQELLFFCRRIHNLPVSPTVTFKIGK